MNFKEYQKEAAKTAIYPESAEVFYPTLGLAGEAGEVANKVKKIYRDSNGKISRECKSQLFHELGDVLWYLAALATDLGINLNDVAEANIDKLALRQACGTLTGSGDNR